MARFPSKEAEVFALAQEMLNGLSANAAVYPSPPCLRASTHRQAVTIADLSAALAAYMTLKNVEKC